MSEYQELYLQTGRDYIKTLNTSLLTLEKNPEDKEAIAEMFRSAHSLKSQSAAMGYMSTGFLCHAIEDVFYEIKEGKQKVTPELADILFSSLDALESSLNEIEKDNKEMDLTAQAEALKKITGVTTEGAGKSNRRENNEQKKGLPITEKPSVPQSQGNETSLKEKSEEKGKVQVKTIVVKVEQLDEIMNLLEELLVRRLQLKRITHQLQNQELNEYYDQSQQIVNALQFHIMKARAVPIGIIFDHFPRTVRDLAREEQKQITLKVEGAEIELDRSIVEQLDQPLVHLIRNAVSHGIPLSQETKTYTITLSAKREREYVVVSVSDDGLGIDWQAVAKKTNLPAQDHELLKKALFSGISTSEKVTQISGRGVGLEVVKKVVEECGGSIDVISEQNKGTTFLLKLPLTLAITKALIVEVEKTPYAIPASYIDRSIKLQEKEIKKTVRQEAFILDKNEIPLIRLKNIWSKNNNTGAVSQSNSGIFVIIIRANNERVGLVVDKIIEAQEVIIKPVSEVLKGNLNFSGVTILGDGQAALIINPPGLIG